MKSNRIGSYAKKAKSDTLSSLLGIIGHGKIETKFLNVSQSYENIYLNKQIDKAVLEAESKKSRALEFVRGLQNR